MPRPPAKCGTDGGYYRHIRTLDEPACDACKEAHRVYEGKRKGYNSAPKPCPGCGGPGTAHGNRCRRCAAIEGQANRAKGATKRRPGSTAPRGNCESCGKPGVKGRRCGECYRRQVQTKHPVWVRDGLIWRAA